MLRVENLKGMRAQLVHETRNQRFYKIEPPVKTVKELRKEKSVKQAFEDAKRSVKPEFIHLFDKSEMDLVCISDAHTHIERLVFAAVEYRPGEFGRTTIQIDGAFTMMIQGGDSRRVKPDAVYLRRLASLNGMAFEGITSTNE